MLCKTWAAFEKLMDARDRHFDEVRSFISKHSFEQFPKEMWPSLYLVQFESGWRNSPRGVKKLERAAKKFERNEKKYERKMRKNEKKTQ